MAFHQYGFLGVWLNHFGREKLWDNMDIPIQVVEAVAVAAAAVVS